MVGAADTELSARLTLGGLMIDSGDIETGFSELYAVKERALELGIAGVAGRSYVNVPSHLEAVGRSREAAEIAEEGVAFTRAYGLVDTEARARGKLAESLTSLGRWNEAAEHAVSVERAAAASASPTVRPPSYGPTSPQPEANWPTPTRSWRPPASTTATTTGCPRTTSPCIGSG